MGFGGYFKGEKKKQKKGAKNFKGNTSEPFTLPQVEILGKNKKKTW
jgi:hypothetical protein